MIQNDSKHSSGDNTNTRIGRNNVPSKQRSGTILTSGLLHKVSAAVFFNHLPIVSWLVKSCLTRDQKSHNDYRSRWWSPQHLESVSPPFFLSKSISHSLVLSCVTGTDWKQGKNGRISRSGRVLSEQNDRRCHSGYGSLPQNSKNQNIDDGCEWKFQADKSAEVEAMEIQCVSELWFATFLYFKWWRWKEENPTRRQSRKENISIWGAFLSNFRSSHDQNGWRWSSDRHKDGLEAFLMEQIASRLAQF